MRARVLLVFVAVAALTACGAASTRPAPRRATSKQARATSTVRAPVPIWSGDDNGAAREISLAVSDAHVMLAEAWGVTILDRASGASSHVRIEEYLPVQTSTFADGRLWLGLGLGEHPSHAPTRISAVDPSTGRLDEIARTHAAPCSLRHERGELFWVDRTGAHLHRARPGGRVRTVASAPAAHHFVSDCRAPLAMDADAVYLLSAPDVPAYRADDLVRVPLDGSAIGVLAIGLPRATLLREIPGALVVARGPGPDVHGSLTRLDLVTRTETVLVAELPRYLDALEVHEGAVYWADGNFFAEDDWAIHRVPLGGGAARVVRQGDRRLFDALAIDATGVHALVSAHPPGECESHYEGCGEHGRMVERCSAPDHQLFFFPAAAP